MKNILNTEWRYNSEWAVEEKADDYAKIPLELINRSDISAKAKAIFAYMTSKPHDYHFASKRICEHFKEGYRAILSAITELEENGYLVKERKADGRMLYAIRENWWSLTVREAKEVLLESFPDAFKRTVRQHERVTFKQAQKAILALLQPHEVGKSYDITSSFAESCSNAELPMDEKTLGSWLKHVERGAFQ